MDKKELIKILEDMLTYSSEDSFKNEKHSFTALDIDSISDKSNYVCYDSFEVNFKKVNPNTIEVLRHHIEDVENNFEQKLTLTYFYKNHFYLVNILSEPGYSKTQALKATSYQDVLKKIPQISIHSLIFKNIEELVIAHLEKKQLNENQSEKKNISLPKKLKV
jgi:hypothetical protein